MTEEKNETQTKEEIRSFRFTEAVALIFVTIIIIVLYIKILIF